MRGGRKTHNLARFEKTPSSPMAVSSSGSMRNLRKNDLGGVIFGCKYNTMKECLSNQLFGLPLSHFSYVKNIEPGLPLFLFNYSDRKLHGIYEAASSGEMNINPYGWTVDGSERTSYPAQVRIRIKTQYQPLLEMQFRAVIGDNYYNNSHFWFELDHAQVTGLIALFTSTSFSGNATLSEGASKRRDLLKGFPNTRWQPDTSLYSERMNPKASESEMASKSCTDVAQVTKYDETLVLDDLRGSDMGDSLFSMSEWNAVDIDQATTNVGPSGANSFVDEESQTLEARSDYEAVFNDEDIVLAKLKQLVVNRERSNWSSQDFVNSIAVPCAKRDLLQDDEQFQAGPSGSADNCTKSLSISSDHSDIAQLRQEMEELKIVTQEQYRRIRVLDTKQVESDQEIQQLKDRVRELELKLNPSIAHADPLDDSPSHLSVHELIFLIGGYDGNSWLSTLNSYSPLRDIITSLRPMSSARSYASAATLNGDIYIFGGGNGSIWYDTVECYNRSSNRWTSCPPLTRAKGSLAGASLENRLFAIGGGNELECLSDVEMFDPVLGRWIRIQSMFQKRFAPAAAEIGGALYVAGGFDGNDYLQTVERFDPREASWTKVQSMNTRRGSHSLTVLNKKLYAIGGYDGNQMVSSVEVFDPRASSWMIGDPMSHFRGYASAVVLGDSLYVIGGVQDRDNIVDSVECYKEGLGWAVINSSAVGKRCFFSAVVL